ncbi:hypothetical protein CLAIMM_09566 [Cladophialophora immunda]|nr:hypothetical protein CLAIMM_09566 [Cladophialophora immunda]
MAACAQNSPDRFLPLFSLFLFFFILPSFEQMMKAKRVLYDLSLPREAVSPLFGAQVACCSMRREDNEIGVRHTHLVTFYGREKATLTLNLGKDLVGV